MHSRDHGALARWGRISSSRAMFGREVDAPVGSPRSRRGGGRSPLHAGAIAGLLVAPAMVLPAAAVQSVNLSKDEWCELARVVSVEELVSWLRDDDLRWNATAAAEELSSRITTKDQTAGVAAVLWPSLDAPDRQEREVVAGLLQIACSMEGSGVVPSSRLLEISVDDALLYEGSPPWRWIHGELDAFDSVAFVSRHARDAAPILVDRLRAASKGGRRGRIEFMAAYLLSFSPGSAPIEEVATPLIEALEDNHVSFDALMGLVALRQIGPAAGGPVRTALAASDDPQQRACLAMLLADWDYPRDAPMRAQALDELQRERLTWQVADPLAEWTFERQRGR